MLVAFLEIALGEKMESEEEEDWASFSLVCTIFYHIISAVRCTLVPRSKIENPESFLDLHAAENRFSNPNCNFVLQIQREEATLMKILLVTMAKRQWWRWKVDEQIYLVTLKLNRRMTAFISYSGIAKTPALLSTGLCHRTFAKILLLVYHSVLKLPKISHKTCKNKKWLDGVYGKPVSDFAWDSNKNIDLNGNSIYGLTPFLNTCSNGYIEVVKIVHFQWLSNTVCQIRFSI